MISFSFGKHIGEGYNENDKLVSFYNSLIERDRYEKNKSICFFIFSGSLSTGRLCEKRSTSGEIWG
jgi:methionine salvage enolase-phosphatase E1